MAIVDLVIPARNEEPNVAALLAALPRERLRHVVVADNGSTDGTADMARTGGAIVVPERQPGYGAACLAGLAWIAEQGTPPDAVAFVDADLSDDPAALPRLIDAVIDDETDLAIGSRAALAEPGALDPHQRFGNALACRMIGLATGRRFRDLGPMRVIRWDALQRLGMADRTWGWMVEMNYKAAAQGLRIVEIDVPYRCRRAGRSKISGSLRGSVKAGGKILWTIGKLWWQSGEAPADHVRGSGDGDSRASVDRTG